MKDDINNIILGNIATVNDLSNGADKVNSVMYGTYPAAIYARVNGSTYTYSKVHNDATTSKTHYFRLNYNSDTLNTVSLAASYTSGTDTLVNSGVSATLGLRPVGYSSFYQNGIDIIVSNKMLALFGFGVLFSVGDLGHNSISRTNANSMLMSINDFNSIPNWGPQGVTVNVSNTGLIPYTYLYSTNGYGSLTSTVEASLAYRVASGNGTTVITENPLFLTGLGPVHLMYGCFRLPTNTFSGTQIYRDASNAYRLANNDISLLVD
jgi:hypothetical protein